MDNIFSTVLRLANIAIRFAPLSFSLLTGIQICSLDMVGRAYEEAPRERRTKIGAFLKLLWAKNMVQPLTALCVTWDMMLTRAKTTMLVNMSSVVAGSCLEDLIWKMAEDTRLLIGTCAASCLFR